MLCVHMECTQKYKNREGKRIRDVTTRMQQTKKGKVNMKMLRNQPYSPNILKHSEIIVKHGEPNNQVDNCV